MNRTIQLATGHYKWGYVLGTYNLDTLSRDIFLTAGNYSWLYCIDPEDGDYRLSSRLQVIVDVDPLPAAYLTPWQNTFIGSRKDYTVGSYLDPLF